MGAVFYVTLVVASPAVAEFFLVVFVCLVLSFAAAFRLPPSGILVLG